MRALAADGVARGDAAGPERELLWARPAACAARVLRAAGAVDAIEGIDRIRYTSPHPKDMREDVIRAHAELPALCEHIHLPLQSGSSRILKAMRRTYDRAALSGSRRSDPRARPRLRADDRHHRRLPRRDRGGLRATLEVVEEVGYDGAFTFLFSPRRGTEAAEIDEGLVPHEVKVERMERLVEVVQRRAHERAQRFVGRTLDVLVEGPSRTDPTRLRGRSRHNKVVNFAGLGSPGETVPVADHLGHVADARGRDVAGRARPQRPVRPWRCDMLRRGGRGLATSG